LFIINFKFISVFPAHAEPLPGWIDNELSAAGEIALISKGILSVTLVDGNGLLNLMPVDSTVRGMITIAWDLGKKLQKLMNFILLHNQNNLN
jgi:hypothetical protein